MYEFGMAVPQSRANAIAWFRKAAAQGHSQAAYFARWLSDPTNNIGFRNQQAERITAENQPCGISAKTNTTVAGIMVAQIA